MAGESVMANIISIDGKKIDIEAQLRDISRAECEESLHEFIRQAWHVVEPGAEFVDNWHLAFICEHLEAITDGHVLEDGTPYNRLLINVPPGTMKSMLVNIFWPAWEWGPCNMPHMRYICAAHQQNLAIRDSTKMRRLVTSDWYQERWGDRVKLTGDQNAKTKFENTATGFREATAAGSITGGRADRVLIDDPLSVEGANSDAVRASTIEWFTEAVPTRLTSPKKSAIVVIMQRLHQDDVSGVILERKGFAGTYDHICLPMRYETWRDGIETKLGYTDPRTEAGELLFPSRFPVEVVDDLEAKLGPYATAGQHQQSPTPRGGGIIKDSWWQLWEPSEYPEIEYIVASLDTAYSTKADMKGDFSALTIWGVFSGDPRSRATRGVDRYGRDFDDNLPETYSSDLNAVPKVILMHAWAERLDIHELVTKTAKDCQKYKVDKILIENKAAGHSVAQEMRRLFSHESFAVQMYDPKSIDKLGRLYSVQHLFAEGMIYAPDKQWAEEVIKQVSVFPRGKHDDLCLVEDTRILMADGSEKLIKEILVGDMVITPNGVQRVSASSITGFKPTWRVDHTNGSLEGTSNHPIFANGEWKELASLCPYDTLTQYQPVGGSPWVSRATEAFEWKRLFLTEKNTTDILIQKTRLIADILRVQALAFIGTFGSFITEKSPKDTKSITLMETPPTMTYRILNACRLSIIGQSIKKHMFLLASPNNKLNIWLRSGICLKNGIAAKKVVNGIEKMRLRHFERREILSHTAKAITQGFANGVGHLSRLKVLKKLCVRLNALKLNQNICVVSSVKPTHTTRPVYNLTVENDNCYYANGILVHNCDTVSMALRHLRDLGLLTRSPERLAEIDQDKQYTGRPPPPLYGV